MVDGVLARLELAPDRAEVSAARRFVRRRLSDHVPSPMLADLQLVTSELVTNAIEHGRPATIVLVVSESDEAIAVRVDSQGPSPEVGPVHTWSIADADDITGRGLGIVREVADEIAVEQTHDALSVVARLRLP